MVSWCTTLDRLGNDSGSRRTSSSLFTCAICQADLEPSEGTSVHVGSVFSSSSKPWEGPFLCSDCRDKKDAMEGKRPSGVKVLWSVTVNHHCSFRKLSPYYSQWASLHYKKLVQILGNLDRLGCIFILLCGELANIVSRTWEKDLWSWTNSSSLLASWVW